MRPADVAAAAELANAVHLAYPEDPAVVGDRLAIYPSGCFVLEDGASLEGQLLSHPWIRAGLPPLDTVLGALPAAPDCYYLHDLVLSEAVRGQGHALAAVDLVVAQARAGGFDTILLVAVSAAHGYWERAGFEPCPDLRPDPAKGYGPEARAYVRRL
jgi:GNAT superfamily N-acetyltransferase